MTHDSAQTVSANDAIDAALLWNTSHGDRSAIGLLYDRHAAGLFAVARAILHSEAEAEDVVHDVFVKLVERASQFRPESGSARAWLNAMTRNACIDRRRRVALRHRLSADVATSSVAPRAEDVAVERAIDGDRALGSIRALSAVQRRTLDRLYCEGMSCSEVAREDGVPVGTVKSRAARAVQALRDQWLEEECAVEVAA
jgi:RNA polymerase sigma-70 factor (ECF subfamily)